MDLCGKVLIAMPGMADPRFSRSVILICAHSRAGAMGLIVNKPLPEVSFAGLLAHLGIVQEAEGAQGGAGRDIRVHIGGPVERGRGFVLHSAEWQAGEATVRVPAVGTGRAGIAERPGAELGMTATRDILDAMARGAGPEQALVALGYSGWGAGQLEAEIARNDWLTAEPVDEVLFSPQDAGKWAGALRGMGIDPVTLSAVAGRA